MTILEALKSGSQKALGEGKAFVVLTDKKEKKEKCSFLRRFKKPPLPSAIYNIP